MRYNVMVHSFLAVWMCVIVMLLMFYMTLCLHCKELSKHFSRQGFLEVVWCTVYYIVMH